MGVRVLTDTTDIPITQMGELCGICWGADTKDHEKNYKRGLDCLRSGHGRVEEYPQVYLEISGYSARVIREFYTHIAGGPTRLQESTRYVLDSEFEYVVPPSIENDVNYNKIYNNTMNHIQIGIEILKKMGAKKEDISMLLPLGMETKIVVRTNLRHLIDMSRQRLCSRAYWEFRKLFKDIMDSLAFYSDEWKFLVEEEKIFVPKCKAMGYCPEKYSCGAAMSKADFMSMFENNWEAM